MMKILDILGFAVIISLMASGTAQAGVSLGTVQVDKVKEIYPGESASFKVLLFNIHSEGNMGIGMNAEYPSGWSIEMPVNVDIPRTDVINRPEPQEGYEFIKAEKGYIKAKPVVIRVSVPESVTAGTYDIRVSARTLGVEGSTLSVSQSRSFRFSAIVREVDMPDEPDNETSEKKGEASLDPSTQPQEEDDIFVIDQDKDRDDTPDENKKDESENESDTNDFVDSVTGAITAYPFSYSVLILVFALLLFSFLKIKKRI